MQGVSLRGIIEFTKGRLVSGGLDAKIKGISTDSRTLAKDDLFIAVKGPNFDGHDFVEEAVRKGASGIVVKDSFSAPADFSGIVIYVKNTVHAFGDIARICRKNFRGSLIGVTGSVGKTTTKEMIACVLSEKFCVHKTEGTLNNHMGVPVTLTGLEPGHDAAVIELGMSGLGEIRYLAGIAMPDVGVITNIAPAHLEQLGSLENIFQSKSELLDVMERDGLAILNRDDAYFQKLRAKAVCRLVTIGRHYEADFQAVDILLDDNGFAVFKMLAKPFNDVLEVKLPVMGMHNIYPAMAAAAVGYGLGISPSSILDGLGKIRLPKLRLESKEIAGVRVIDDCYNANPVSMESALETLSLLRCDGKRIFVCSDMRELGVYSSMYHEELGRNVCRYKVDRLVTIGEFSGIVRDTAVRSGLEPGNAVHCKNNIDAVEVLGKWIEPGDMVLIKGSRANRMEEITKGIEEYYSTLERLIV